MPKCLKASLGLVEDRNSLLTFYDLSTEYWTRLRTTYPVVLTFGMIRHRTDQARGYVARITMLAMFYKLGMCAEKHWWRIRGLNHLAKPIEGLQFKDGIKVKKKTENSNVA